MASRSANTERSSWLGHQEYVGALRDQAALFSAALRHSASDSPVPSCPDWTALDLARHVVQVYAHKAAVLRAGTAVSGSDVDAAGDASLPEALERHDTVVADLADVLAGMHPDDAAWTWMEGAGESTVGAWARRMAHEAFVHRADAELTVGRTITPVDAAFAVDGLNEVLTWMAGDPDVVAEDQGGVGSAGSVLFDCGHVAWLVELGEGTHVVTPAVGTSADVRIGADPMALDLLSWGRPSSATWPAAAVVDRLRTRITASLR
ncbi:maleylpyruvate isomerase family mycothiol-dependent enzyme [Mycolicibacterium sp. P1-18]|uniref:maleylpyruvate isomerase N-terminal domain-containing protein n=1 Tax=Mycolicibacterium sp. P1-18 TaxID=2024615 RepID=UPI0011F33D1A|nr:maleylpyruvate isomerase N-terminal domain-containing protein [Mycolicibacterium sp. P1-18]KAA0099586.1 maleylpyruvate isomerase family mycothiol-dependent enzyme [Mycolicibacterium sp. P1-18]